MASRIKAHLYSCVGKVHYDAFLDQKRRITTATAEVRADTKEEAQKRFEKWLSEINLEGASYDPRDIVITEKE